MKEKTYKPEYFTNRELSWLDFNERILNEARDKSIPLLERFKFLSITASNLDEFFMVRVASILDLLHADYEGVDIAGMSAKEQLDAIRSRTRKFQEEQYVIYNRSLLPQLLKKKICIIEEYEGLSKEQERFVNNYYESEIYPVLTPMAVDASRPFPLVQNKTLNIAALISRKGKPSKLIKDEAGAIEFATVAVPSVLPRLIEIPSEDDNDQTFIFLEQIIEKNIHKLFLNYEVKCAFPYRIMRNADIEIDEEETADLLLEMEKRIRQRQWGEVIRLEIEEGMDKRLLKVLKKNLEVSDDAIIHIHGPIDLTAMMKLGGLISGKRELFDPSYNAQTDPIFESYDDENIFDKIAKGDIFLHHPYFSFQPVVDFIRQAAVDPQVLAIKQTLYRVSGNSPIIAALAQAAENGKQVTVLVELKARFDEENNIVWARKLEQAGCHVIYGLVGLKIHSKIALVVRRESDGIRRYVHLGTGNYNDSTAKLYTDCGLFTCKEAFGEDATAVFNMLSGYSEPPHWNKLIVSPIWMRERFFALIDREIANAKAGKKAHIIGKMNSLCDERMICKLYEASTAGVTIDLIIRGICCLRVGIPGVSENIHVSSIVGKFLEHNRTFYFYNDGAEDIYMGSADWMPRNLDRRVEIIFPVEEPAIKARIKHILSVQLSDNLKAYYMQPDGEYIRIDRRGKKPVVSQAQFMHEAAEMIKKPAEPVGSRRFTPIKAEDNNE